MNIEYMELAVKEALKAYEIGEVPVGAVIVKNDKIIGKAYNKKELLKNAVAHAEVLAIKEATNSIGNWRLDDCDIYTTLEPCPMCASAIKQSRIKNVYVGLASGDEKNLDIIMKIFEKDKNNGSVSFYNNLFPEKIHEVMKKFFSVRRKK